MRDVQSKTLQHVLVFQVIFIILLISPYQELFRLSRLIYLNNNNVVKQEGSKVNTNLSLTGLKVCCRTRSPKQGKQLFIVVVFLVIKKVIKVSTGTCIISIFKTKKKVILMYYHQLYYINDSNNNNDLVKQEKAKKPSTKSLPILQGQEGQEFVKCVRTNNNN